MTCGRVRGLALLDGRTGIAWSLGPTLRRLGGWEGRLGSGMRVWGGGEISTIFRSHCYPLKLKSSYKGESRNRPLLQQDFLPPTGMREPECQYSPPNTRPSLHVIMNGACSGGHMAEWGQRGWKAQNVCGGGGESFKNCGREPASSHGLVTPSLSVAHGPLPFWVPSRASPTWPWRGNPWPSPTRRLHSHLQTWGWQPSPLC